MKAQAHLDLWPMNKMMGFLAKMQGPIAEPVQDFRTCHFHSSAPSTRGGFNTNRSTRPKCDGWKKFADWAARLTGEKQSRSQMRFLWEEALGILGGLGPNLIQNIAERLADRNNIGRLYIEQVVIPVPLTPVISLV